MKPAPLSYQRVHDAEAAVERLAELGAEAKLLAGGQSLVPMMNFRLARPSVLIDISRVSALRGVRRDGPELRVGAATPHRELTCEATGAGYDVFAEALPLIGHEPIRSCGTFGGSLAHADPAAEWCLLLLLLGGSVVARSVRGERAIDADKLFHGFFLTALAPDELLVEACFRRPPGGAAIREHARRHGDFALVLAGAAVECEDGRCRSARVVVGGVGEVPLRLAAAERAIEGSHFEEHALAECAEAARRSVEPATDAHATAEHRRKLTGALVVAAVRAAAARAGAERSAADRRSS